jgi:hypothetical protein
MLYHHGLVMTGNGKWGDPLFDAYLKKNADKV